MGGTDPPAGKQRLSLGSQEEEERRFLPPHHPRHHEQLLLPSGHPVPRESSAEKEAPQATYKRLLWEEARRFVLRREVRPERRHGAEVCARLHAEAGLWDRMLDGRGEMLWALVLAASCAPSHSLSIPPSLPLSLASVAAPLAPIIRWNPGIGSTRLASLTTVCVLHGDLATLGMCSSAAR